MLRKNNKLLIFLIVLASLAVLAAGSVAVVYRIYLNRIRPVSEVDQQVAFTVEEGESMNDIIYKLYEEGLIQDVNCSKVFVKLNRVNDYYAGNFMLNYCMSNAEIFEILSDQSNCIQDEVDVKIVDGAWAKDIAEAIAEKTNLTAEQLMANWNDLEYIKELIERYDCLTDAILNSEHCYLEGYLLPETYRFFEITTVQQVTEKMLDQTEAIYDQYREDIESSSLTTHEIFTLASIIQFESGDVEDNKLVSSVFYNRMRDGWPLQSSVTVCYALYEYGSGDDCEKDSNLELDSKYNTYLYDGLPIGPVCNPNAAAIDAAIHPADTDYYFFIGSNGVTYYATTLDQHYYNIEHYLY